MFIATHATQQAPRYMLLALAMPIAVVGGLLYLTRLDAVRRLAPLRMGAVLFFAFLWTWYEVWSEIATSPARLALWRTAALSGLVLSTINYCLVYASDVRLRTRRRRLLRLVVLVCILFGAATRSVVKAPTPEAAAGFLVICSTLLWLILSVLFWRTARLLEDVKRFQTWGHRG